ncbi:hypothetical protein [Gordonia aichiensis]|uniref:CobQ/CobB/MinD/ParA nucleotide binding domain-containing protein n=1 Tax=Gordonia aichiensis NBRC 108223 TaxID=1220583 RepID=L7KJL5_9ACTN|nr:hypothetical protein [Gordonia aichiensis]GAC48799.1 hypothetical protein GOACH_07_00830 [Gordonia aichiensis NBRC 108223]
MTDNPQAVTPRPASSPNAVVVVGSAGGVGTSVISALLAEYRAATTVGAASWWVDASGNDCDIELRLQGRGDPALLRTELGTGLHLAPEGVPLVDTVEDVWRNGASPIVDAGARLLTSLADLTDEVFTTNMVTPVIVLGPRPDLLNRARPFLSEWRKAGVLERAVIVLNNPLPIPDQGSLGKLVTDTVGGSVAAVIGFDYEPVLGTGLALGRPAQEKFLPATWVSIRSLAEAVQAPPGP